MAVVQHPLHHLHGGLGRGFAVDGRHQAATYAAILLRGCGAGQDGLLGGGIAHARALHRARGVPEEFGIAHMVGGGILQIFIGNALQIGRRLQQPLVECAQHAQHAHGLFAARVEGLDLFGSQRRLGALHQFDEGVFSDRAQQVAVQLHLGDGVGKGGQFRCGGSRRGIHAADGSGLRSALP
jgi:hypothetical protein